MKEIWILSVRTSLPNTCWDKSDLIESVESFDSFEKARTKLREVVKGFAFSENAMFDSQGSLINFEAYIEDMDEDEEENCANNNGIEPGYITKQFYLLLTEKLKKVFAGEDVKFDLPKGKYFDCFISTHIGDGTLKMNGYDDGPINGIDPRIKTNIIDMTNEKDYYLYIDDFFGGLWGQECSAELYIDLKRTEME